MPHHDVDTYEAALRRLPEAHSLALRLKSADVADEVVRLPAHRAGRPGHVVAGGRGETRRRAAQAMTAGAAASTFEPVRIIDARITNMI